MSPEGAEGAVGCEVWALFVQCRAGAVWGLCLAALFTKQGRVLLDQVHCLLPRQRAGQPLRTARLQQLIGDHRLQSLPSPQLACACRHDTLARDVTPDLRRRVEDCERAVQVRRRGGHAGRWQGIAMPHELSRMHPVWTCYTPGEPCLPCSHW